MTNEELAELLAKVKYTAEHGVFDAAEKSMLADMEGVATALEALIATAREVEALRAENARLAERINRFDNAASLFYQLRTTIMVRFDGLKSTDSALWRSINAAFDKLEAARAALEQGEAAILRAERNEP